MRAITRPLTVSLILILWSGGATRPTSAQEAGTDPGEWYATFRAVVEAEFEELLNRPSLAEAPVGVQAQVRAQLEGFVRGILANLDIEAERLERRVLTEQTEHVAGEDRFCGPESVAGRLIPRVSEDPADAQNALLAGFQCRTAYRGAVSRPATEERESLRERCLGARERILEPVPPATVEGAALWALVRCSAYEGAAEAAYNLTGDYGMIGEAAGIVLDLRNSFQRGEFAGP